ncbi:MAG: uridine kinase [Gemmatimonadota bacterium]|nr:uridine kinase [Gemmatimonadota bacterium]
MSQAPILDLATLVVHVTITSADGPRVLVGVDGPGASGKSTLAELLAEVVPLAHVVHVDDFYLPSAQHGTRSGLVGPLFDLPRLAAQVVTPAATGGSVRYQRYDWTDDQLAEWVEVPQGAPVIVEGVYCLESALRDSYTFTVFCRADRALRLRRGFERDGEQARSQWLDEWMPAEDDYAARQRPEEFADLVLDSTVVDGQPQFLIVRSLA